MKTIQVGILGTGSIASQFAKTCSMVEGAAPYGVASRSLEKAQAFAKENGVLKGFGSHEALVSDPEIDLVYVATPHPIHFEDCMLALRHGKHVLCEKPMVMTKAQAKDLFDYAEAHELFIMEGMWTRFLPNTIQAKRWIDEGRIGKVKFIDMIFSFSVDMNNPKDRLVNPALGGGSMYDLGVYTVEMASFYAGANPISYSGYHTDFCPGADATAVMAVKYPNDILATLRTGIVANAPVMGTIVGDKGYIELPRFYLANDARLMIDGKIAEECHMTYNVSEGFCWQLRAVCGYINNGMTDSPVVPHADTLATIEILEGMMKSFYGSNQ
ncbi:MAG: Gfo/Idh/MocA family protein [Acetanaerobacterium sp.]